MKNKEVVILLHGIFNSSKWMNSIEKYLAFIFYDIINITYPYSEMTIEELGQDFLPTQLKGIEKYEKVHFVTHSMGGLVVRSYLEKNKLPNMGKVVQLAPPNQGSEVHDFIRKNSFLSWIYAKIGGTKSGMQLGTQEDSFAFNHRNEEINYELGVIAGKFSILPFSFVIPGADDGLVSVESTKISGMEQHIILPYEHLFFTMHEDVKYQTAHFLKNGHFMKCSH